MKLENKVEQMELIMAEIIADIDQHTAILNQHTALHQKTQAQIKQLYHAVEIQGKAIAQQSDAIINLTQGQIRLEQKIDEGFAKMTHDISMILSILRDKN
jgi:biotin-(acetyl-CoA carboxylase) ligase